MSDSLVVYDRIKLSGGWGGGNQNKTAEKHWVWAGETKTWRVSRKRYKREGNNRTSNSWLSRLQRDEGLLWMNHAKLLKYISPSAQNYRRGGGGGDCSLLRKTAASYQNWSVVWIFWEIKRKLATFLKQPTTAEVKPFPSENFWVALREM